MPWNGSGSSSNYTVAETESFRTSLRNNKALSRLYPRTRDTVYPLLRSEPHLGPHIKRDLHSRQASYRSR